MTAPNTEEVIWVAIAFIDCCASKGRSCSITTLEWTDFFRMQLSCKLVLFQKNNRVEVFHRLICDLFQCFLTWNRKIWIMIPFRPLLFLDTTPCNIALGTIISKNSVFFIRIFIYTEDLFFFLFFFLIFTIIFSYFCTWLIWRFSLSSLFSS